jgi:sphinganine-1-phosphate aldolase
MCVDLYKGGANGVGSLTTGGTESILVAMCGYREWARKTKGIRHPEIIIPVTAHAAFNKAAGYFGMPIITVPVDPKTFQVDIRAVEAAISGRTAVLVGSAPCFPTGTVDNITELGKLALKYNIGLHVDACLGGFVLPFVKMAGYEVPDVDFSVPGVTSISCDVHKYGCTPKGISTLMWKNTEMRRFQYFVTPEWTGGIYATPTITGSKNGSISAAAWAVMNCYGKDGYTENGRLIRVAVDTIKDGIRGIPELEVMGDPIINVIAFTSTKINIYKIYDRLTENGWHAVSLQNPSGIHLCVTSANCFRAAEYVKDIGQAVRDELANPTKIATGATALYGMAE